MHGSRRSAPPGAHGATGVEPAHEKRAVHYAEQAQGRLVERAEIWRPVQLGIDERQDAKNAKEEGEEKITRVRTRCGRRFFQSSRLFPLLRVPTLAFLASWRSFHLHSSARDTHPESVCRANVPEQAVVFSCTSQPYHVPISALSPGWQSCCFSVFRGNPVDKEVRYVLGCQSTSQRGIWRVVVSDRRSTPTAEEHDDDEEE